MKYVWLIAALVLFSCSQNLEESASDEELSEEESFHKSLSDSVVISQPGNSFKAAKDFFPGYNKLNFEDSLKSLYSTIDLKRYGLPYKVFRHGMIGFMSLKQEGKINEKNMLSIIDFTQSSCNKRFFTIDLDKKDIIYNTYVSHGRGSGGDKPDKFSNTNSSYQSSLGFYVTAETYTGSKGYSMRLDGMEEGYNQNMRDRAIVMHNANYVSEDFIKKYGRLGRSQGCPALPKGLSKKVINTIKEGTAIFAYYDDSKYIKASRYLNLDSLMSRWEYPADSLLN